MCMHTEHGMRVEHGKSSSALTSKSRRGTSGWVALHINGVFDSLNVTNQGVHVSILW